MSIQDIKELGKQLLPEASGVKLSEIAWVLDFKKMKILDPHETIRAIAWHDLPGDGNIVLLTRFEASYIFACVCLSVNEFVGVSGMSVT